MYVLNTDTGTTGPTEESSLQFWLGCLQIFELFTFPVLRPHDPTV